MFSKTFRESNFRFETGKTRIWNYQTGFRGSANQTQTESELEPFQTGLNRATNNDLYLVIWCLSIADEELDVCCSSRQIQDLKISFGQALAVVTRCPSCARNLRMVFCSMTCHPQHSKFLSPASTVKGGNQTLIKTLNYYIQESYSEALFDSCKEVTNPSSNSLAIQMFCGEYGEDCDPNRYSIYTEWFIDHCKSLYNAHFYV